MEVGLVRRIDIDSEMQQSYLDYAMSVIVARALPDARDGLKPVHRRILHAMHAMGIRPDGDYKKSARIVGEVLGKYHPHGDMAVYDAMARMAQVFSMRYPLIDGQGNFGSVDGDPPAAMRYTEARLAALTTEMLADLDKDTVDYTENFDGSLEEPVVLPAALPNLLVNGATGIAVGMATSIPPHNMGEVCEALIYMLENWSRLEKISVDDLMSLIQGPDFPTGGIIVHQPKETGEDLASAYGTGRGKITIHARAHIEDMGRGRSRIIVTELPFQTNKSNLIERIADLARSGQLDGLADLRDESDRQGMRIVIELVKTAEPEKVLAELYRRTPMQNTFSVIILALVDGEPRLLNLKQALRLYLEHRLEVVRRRSEYELTQARERAHVLEGLRIALSHLDEVIQIIRRAKDADQAGQRLQRRFKLSAVQTRAILDMPLRRLASLERKKIDREHAATKKRITALESLLASQTKMRTLIIQELTAVKETYGDRRRTQIVQAGSGRRARSVLTARDLAPAKETWVVITAQGQISRTPTARLPRLSGRKAPKLVVGASGRDVLYLFDQTGEGVAVAVHTLPECEDPSEGNPLVGATPFQPDANIVTGIAIPTDRGGEAESGWFLLFGTAAGLVKKTAVDEFPGPSAKTFRAINVNEGDRLRWVRLTKGADEICLVSSAGMAIRFAETDVRPMGLNAAGVLGIRLETGQEVVGMDLVRPRSDLLVLSDKGLAKRTSLSQFPRQGRYGKGVLAWKSDVDARLIGAAISQPPDRAIATFARSAARTVRFSDTKRRARAAAGVKLFDVSGSNRLTGLHPVIPRPAIEDEQRGIRRGGAEAKSTARSTSKRKPESVKGKPKRAQNQAKGKKR